MNGDGQTATVATSFSQNLRVQVKDQFGNVIPNTTVTFTAPASGASATLFPQGGGVTDSNGMASAGVLAGNIAGTYKVTASAGSAANTLMLTNQAAAPAALTATNGGGQSAQVTQPFANPLQATVTDIFGNPVSGAQVQFVASPNGASANLGSLTATTDTNGRATTTAAANTVAGAYTVTGPHQSPPQLHLVRQRRSQAAKASLQLALHLCQTSSESRPRSRARTQRCEQ